MSFLMASPFSSAVGQRIEQATDATLASENWSLNMEICDLVNESDDGPRDAIKAIRKRLQQNAGGKNYTVVMYTLTVLETCVKNCGRKFHVLACNKEFVQELVKLIGPKNDPPTAVQEKVLSLIQSWADAFRHQGELAGVVQVYTDLKQKGVEFPMTDLDTMAPIHTPQRSVRGLELQSTTVDGSDRVSPVPLCDAEPSAVPAPTVTLTQEQMGKLQSELDVVQGNMTVLSEMLSELTPGQEHPNDMQLLKELHDTCQAMKHRLVELIGKLNNDEITAELLRINDELNNVFLRYSRFENNRSGPQPRATPTQGDDTDLLSCTPGIQAIDLLDCSSETGVTDEKKTDKEDTEFDMFAQSRNVTYESSKTAGSTYKDNLEPDQVNGSLGAVALNRSQPPQIEREIDEMAAWLGDKPPSSGAATEESLTSGEFEKFLAERAAAAEQLPTTAGADAARNNRPHHPRQLNKEADSDSSLFAL